MTPAERARKIEQLEFERHCQEARLRAQRYSEEHRRHERRRLEEWFGRPLPESGMPKPRVGKPAKLYTFNGQQKCLTEWANIAGVSYELLTSRIRSGMPFEKAITMKFRQRAELHDINRVLKTMSQWAEYTGISYDAMMKRLRDRTLAQAIVMSVPLPRPSLKKASR